MSAAPYRAVLFDLFDTLIVFDRARLPEIVVDGRRIPSTLGVWGGLVEDMLPGVGVEAFARALAAASAELDVERRVACIERPSRERFYRALIRVACPAERATELASTFARAHMQTIADATLFPPAHAQVLERVRRDRRTAIITNFDDTATAYDILARHGILGSLDAIVVSEAVGLRKPHGALVRLALRDLEVSATDAVMVGDHAVEDVGAATAAGVDAVWIDARGDGIRAGNPIPRYIVRSLVELTGLLG